MGLAEALNDSAIEEIRLLHNHISDNGCCALAQMLMKNFRITSMELQDNKIGDAGVMAMAEVVRHNTVLEDLNLHMNVSVSDQGLTAMHEALQHNSTLQSLLLYNFRFSESTHDVHCHV